MKYLLTGASGFAGRYLGRHLADAGHQVYGLVRRPGSLDGEPVTEVLADLFDEASVIREVGHVQPEGIFHLAAPETSPRRSWEIPAETLHGNLVSSLAILEAARRLSRAPRLLFVSSIVVQQPDQDSPYAVSKKLGEDLALLYQRAYELPVVIARPSNHTGPGQSTEFAVPSFARQIAAVEAGRQPTVKVGNLAGYKDFTDVRDVVRAYALLLEKGETGRVYPVASGQTVKVGDILQALLGLATATIEVTTGEQKAEEPPPAIDISGLSALGWEPQIPLAQTWRDLLDYERHQLTERQS